MVFNNKDSDYAPLGIKNKETMGLFSKLEEFAFGENSKQSAQSSESMYPQELEHLIDIAIEDGNITDKERLVLYKKAAKFDIDPDELDMVLESRLNNGRRIEPSLNSEQSQPKVLRNKGSKKCPSCGALLSAPITVHCPYCGYKVVNIVRDILEDLNSIVPIEKKVERPNSGFFGKVLDFLESDDGYAEMLERKENLILGYQIPVAKEVILEFLAYSVQKGCKDKKYDCWQDELGEAWYKKSEQVIAEARITFNQDAEFMARLKDYAVKFGMEKRGLFRR